MNAAHNFLKALRSITRAAIIQMSNLNTVGEDITEELAKLNLWSSGEDEREFAVRMGTHNIHSVIPFPDTPLHIVG